MEYFPRNWRGRMGREKKGEGVVAISFLISLFPRSSPLPRLDYTLLDSYRPYFRRKIVLHALPSITRDNTEGNTHRHRHRNRNHRFFFSEQFHLSCIRILLLFLFFSSVSSTCFLCLFHFFLRFSLSLRFHHCVTFLLHFTRHERT